MILLFPDVDVLRLVLTGGLLPAETVVAKVRYSFDSRGGIAVETSARLPKKTTTELARLGVEPIPTHPAEPRSVSCWPQILPVTRDSALPQLSTQTPVLFELESAADLPTLVTEMLRLGNDRQTLRWLVDSTKTLSDRVLLRVLGPPYYTLLRALESSTSGTQGTVRAFLERAPRVWVQIGFSQPFADRLKPAEGQFVLIRPTREWEFLADGPFRDVYELVHFELPANPVAWETSTAYDKIEVPLRLVAGNAADTPELWVLRDGAVDKLDAFVRDADERISQRLKFAVATEANGQAVVVLRVTSSKVPPPTLPIAGAVGFKPYFKLPNLFIPSGTRLHPTLRRDAVRKLLADDPDRLAWLSPGPDGGFVPESLPEDSFRPLEDWVDYIVAANAGPLAAWVDSTRFDFDSFVCAETAKPKPDDGPGKPKKKSKGDAEVPLVPSDMPVKSLKVGSETGDEPNAQSFAAMPEMRPPDEWIIRRKALEDEFLGIDGPLDSPARAALWPKLARATARAGATDDAAICWVNAMWEQPPNRELADEWMRSEIPDPVALGSPVEFDRLIVPTDPAPSDLRRLTALVYRLTFEAPLPAWFKTRLPAVQRYLELQEGLVPLRAVWLTASRLAVLAGADTLGLARVRDRIWLRLLGEGGLKTERDLPSFLKYDGVEDSERVRQVRDRVLELHEKVRTWAEASLNLPGQPPDPSSTLAYIDLFFAFGLAKLGEVSTARKLVAQGKTLLERYPSDSEKGIAGRFLFRAYSYRIENAIAGKSATGPFSNDILDSFSAIAEDRHQLSQTHPYAINPKILSSRNEVYAILKLREQSRILEPQEINDPYIKNNVTNILNKQHSTQKLNRSTEDRLATELYGFATERDSIIFSLKVRNLYFNGIDNITSPELRYKIMHSAFRRGILLKEDLAIDLLMQVPQVLTHTVQNPSPAADYIPNQCLLLERAIFIAGHFGKQNLVFELAKLVLFLYDSKSNQGRIEVVNYIAIPLVRSMIKFGLKSAVHGILLKFQEISKSYKTFSELESRLTNASPKKQKHETPVSANPWHKCLASILNVSTGCYALGEDFHNEDVSAKTRSILATASAKTMNQTDAVLLTRAYVTNLCNNPNSISLDSIIEFYDTLPPSLITNSTSMAQFYSRYHLNLVEDTVLAIVSDDFTLGPAGRRWLDEDEHLVRRRIHRDVKSALDRSGL